MIPFIRGKVKAIILVVSILSITYLSTSPSPVSPLSANRPWGHVSSWLGSDNLRLRYLDGVAYVDQLGDDGRHPIEALIARGKQKAAALERKKEGVKTLRHAVRDYVDAYGMQPPEGFDECLDVPAVPSLFPLAHNSVLPFLSLPARLLRQRAQDLVLGGGIFGIEYRPEAETPAERVKAVHDNDGLTHFKTLHTEWVDLSLLDGARIPRSQNPQDPMLLAVWVDDVSHHPPSARLLRRSRELAHAGQVWDEEELLALEAEEATKKGWGNACEPAHNRFSGQDALSAVQRMNAQVSSFVDDPMIYADPCTHPEHLRQNGEMIMKEEWNVGGLLPLTSLNSPIGGGEIIGPTTVGRNSVAPYMPWSSKVESRLWWRGNAHSAFYYDRWDWRASQRFRLSDYASGRRERIDRDKAGTPNLKESTSPVLLERELRLKREWRDRDLLRKTYLDIALISTQRLWSCGGHYSHAFFCHTPDGRPNATCPQLDTCDATLDAEYDFAPWADRSYETKHKFRLDVDGFGWTTRWREELSKNNVVIKATLYLTCKPEWWSPQAIPWHSYIPASYTFAELYDIMAFFTGTPEERGGKITPQRKKVLAERDEMAEGIATRGREFAMTRLRHEDMRVYMFLLLLEYRRAWSDDRIAATFRLE